MKKNQVGGMPVIEFSDDYATKMARQVLIWYGMHGIRTQRGR